MYQASNMKLKTKGFFSSRPVVRGVSKAAAAQAYADIEAAGCVRRSPILDVQEEVVVTKKIKPIDLTKYVPLQQTLRPFECIDFYTPNRLKPKNIFGTFSL